MAMMIRTGAAALAGLALLACSEAIEGPAPTTPAAAAGEVIASAETALDRQDAERLQLQKPAFEAALAAGDASMLNELADTGNAFALHHRARQRIDSHDFMLQQAGFEDMEEAADLGLPEALVWVGERKAYGKDGYKLQPNSGLMMMERAARRGHLEAMMAVAGMYESDAYMADRKKARAWYERAAEAGSADAREALSRLEATAAERRTP